MTSVQCRLSTRTERAVQTSAAVAVEVVLGKVQGQVPTADRHNIAPVVGSILRLPLGSLGTEGVGEEVELTCMEKLVVPIRVGAAAAGLCPHDSSWEYQQKELDRLLPTSFSPCPTVALL